jgi:hypothetical protein
VAAEATTRQEPSDWKNHPVLIVGGAVVATALACLTYFNEFALPQRTARLEDSAFRADEQAKKLESDLRREQETNTVSKLSIKSLEDKQELLSKLLTEARTSDLFVYKSAYPNGFATVKVGMKAEDVYAAYPKTAIKPNELGYLSVTLKNSPFEYIVYYYDEDTESKVITHITFNLPYTPGKSPSQDLVKRLTESLGKPLHIPPKYYAWPTLDEANVFVSDSDSYMVMRSGYRPALWPTEKEAGVVCKEIAKNQCPIPTKK